MVKTIWPCACVRACVRACVCPQSPDLRAHVRWNPINDIIPIRRGVRIEIVLRITDHRHVHDLIMHVANQTTRKFLCSKKENVTALTRVEDKQSQAAENPNEKKLEKPFPT